MLISKYTKAFQFQSSISFRAGFLAVVLLSCQRLHSFWVKFTPVLRVLMDQWSWIKVGIKVFIVCNAQDAIEIPPTAFY